MHTPPQQQHTWEELKANTKYLTPCTTKWHMHNEVKHVLALYYDLPCALKYGAVNVKQHQILFKETCLQKVLSLSRSGFERQALQWRPALPRGPTCTPPLTRSSLSSLLSSLFRSLLLFFYIKKIVPRTRIAPHKNSVHKAPRTRKVCVHKVASTRIAPHKNSVHKTNNLF